MGPIESRIHEKLTTAFEPVHIELDNESHSHSVPQNSETHFRLVLVSAKFDGVSRVQRSRLVHEALDAELKGGVHALTLRCLSPSEWQVSGAENFVSPNCHSSSKHK